MRSEHPQQLGEQDSALGFDQQFESFLEGSLKFIRRFLATPWSLVRHPRRVAQAFLLDKGQQEASSLPPLTFLFASAFLFTFVASSYSSYPLRGYKFEEAAQRIPETFGSNLSIVQVFILALPISLAALLAAYVVDFLTTRKNRRLPRIAFFTYVASFQMLAFFVFSFVVVASSLGFEPYAYPGELRVGGPDKYFPRALFVGCFLWVLALLSLVVSINVPRVLLEATRGAWNLRQRLWMTILMVLLIQLPGLSALSAAVALDVLPNLVDKREPTPLTLVEQRFWRVPGGAEARFKLYIENNENYAVTIVDRGRDSTLDLRWPLTVQATQRFFTSAPLHLVDSPGGGSPFVEVPSMGRSWVVLGGHISDDGLRTLEEAVNSEEKRDLIALWLWCERGAKLGSRGHVLYEIKLVPEI